MTIIKIIVVPAFVALLIGCGGAYFLSSFERQESFKMHKNQVEENATNRREEVCKEVETLFPENPALAIEIIEREIHNMNRRKTTRWQE